MLVEEFVFPLDFLKLGFLSLIILAREYSVFASWVFVSLSLDPPLELPSFYMTPSHRQVVFEGDSLPFQCMASYIDQDMQVLWYQDGRIVETDESQGIFVEKNMIHNCSLIAR